MSEKETSAPSPERPTLGDILQLQATIEGVPETGIRQLSPTENIAVNRFSEGAEHSEGKMIGHISKTQRQPNGSYMPVMNYIILRDGDETTTRLIKRPPFELPQIPQVLSREAADELKQQAESDLALYGLSRKLGLYDITADEIRELTATISNLYLPRNK